MDLPYWHYLVEKYFDNSISKDELDHLLELIDAQENFSGFKTVLQNYWNVVKERPIQSKVDWDKKLDELFAEAREQVQAGKKKGAVRGNALLWLAAASLIAFIIASSYLFTVNKPRQEPARHSAVARKDIAPPTKNTAILTLANGKMISLDSVSKGSVAIQGNTSVEKLSDDQIVYNGKATGEMEYNTLTVPRGSRVASITLSDGSKVWLNSASTLKYPVAFAGVERKVEITGEAYFEVAHNNAMPFKVSKGEITVTVLGTHFNLNAYDDEGSVKVTLLEGSVQVDKGNHSMRLKPGQQALISSAISVNEDVDVEEVMAWKNGQFQFGEASDINSIMRQISRWYDVDIEYKGELSGHIGGSISRDENISQVLKMLQMTGAVKFEIGDKKIIVLSNKL